jgi:hypothetical protein
VRILNMVLIRRMNILAMEISRRSKMDRIIIAIIAFIVGGISSLLIVNRITRY